MTSLVVMLFFGLTGLLLNHQGWTLGQSDSTQHITGTLPANLRTTSTTNPDFLGVSEYVRSTDSITGQVNWHGTDNGSGWINYLGPGYQANLRWTPSSGAYEITVTKTGLVGVLNDIHRSKGTGTVWSWINDIAAVLLVLIGLTGLLIVFMTRSKNRRRDLVLGTIGLVLAVLALWTTQR